MPDDDRVEPPDEPEATTAPPLPAPVTPAPGTLGGAALPSSLSIGFGGGAGVGAHPPFAELGGSARAADQASGTSGARRPDGMGGLGPGGSGVLPPGPKYGGGRTSDQGQPQYLDSLDSADIVDRISADGVFEPPGDFEG
ncbi:hypothetical protein [Kutzneria buriramensis]|uniref:Uncharacterized protein n=1 Tax=Kutzneria buriramensis TaxID=1045776 RepID=A0A3E0HG39_9PSEU|nr:hypothetical protein [Kutzneria buriramensis]REH44760.1 hypothetical protein BCF44_108240 [Kutzneria buriramensis]